MSNVVRKTSPRRYHSALLALATCQVACVTNSNLCLPGYVYSSQYDACLQVGGDADDGGDDASAMEAATDAAVAADGGAADSSAGDGGLGSSCNSSSDCPAQASYCLKSPTAAASAPGICTIPGCTAAECGSGYSCCDCTSSSLAPLAAWPKNVCAPSSDDSDLVAFGCTCQ
jgi:hypothetical protein